ncbi:HNH endonuclease [Mycobacterium phage BobSwaget]|nr:HNH endonuclease [Mycobacterium phage BobSwaget]ASW31350.1 HNH endonuclease [Mycobacterium phage Lokk]QDF18401.1 HNH endonuclease [Mycobacterium Phage Rachaly]QGH78700.1 HNH endonuclease [Mycobacterium phage Miko]
MSWAGSRRRHELPPDWEARRLTVLSDANWICEIQYEGRCVGTATEVDHIERGNDHSYSNLRAACHRCHAKKSSIEGNAARWANHARRKRPEQRHPGRR